MLRPASTGRIAAASRSSGPLLAVAAALVLAAVDGGAAAPHKTHRTPPAANPRDTDTSATGTLPAKAPPKHESQIPAVGNDDETLPPPFHLPQASRARMRDCGLKWQAMKSSGEAGEGIWRDFATRCLAATNGPSNTRSDR